MAAAVSGGRVSSGAPELVQTPELLSPAAEPPAVFVARDESQARDWALVLVSRNIESTLGRDPVSGKWFLLLPAALREKGIAELRAYHRENRRWLWRGQHEEPPLNFHWGALAWVLANVFAFQFGPVFAARGWFDPVRFAKGEWWRSVTALWLHHDIVHLASNGIYGSLVMGLALGRFGLGIGLMGGMIGGVAGNLLGYWYRSGQEYTGLGASGMVMAGLGMLAAQSVVWWKHGLSATRFVLPGLFAGGFLFLQLGTSPGSDVIAHLGGFLAGLVFGGIAAWMPDRLRLRWNRPAAGIFVAISVFAWLLALR